jgi:Amt family ammonium transporter
MNQGVARRGAAAAAFIVTFALAGAAHAEVPGEVAFVFNTFSFLICGVLVMWMAAGFAMLESGLVRSKNTATVCLKNVSLYCVACFTFYLVGYNLMYADVGGFAGSLARTAAGRLLTLTDPGPAGAAF